MLLNTFPVWVDAVLTLPYAVWVAAEAITPASVCVPTVDNRGTPNSVPAMPPLTVPPVAAAPPQPNILVTDPQAHIPNPVKACAPRLNMKSVASAFHVQPSLYNQFIGPWGKKWCIAACTPHSANAPTAAIT